MLNRLEEDRLKLKFYREFHEKNRELFKTDRMTYCSDQMRYVERRLEEVKVQRNGTQRCR